jgi:hypothetical protein
MGSVPSEVPVFISHSAKDKAAARAISRYLQSRGWRVWIDEVGIAEGKKWHGALMNALESTWVVLLVVSINSMRSKWVVREVQAADRLGKEIIPVVVDDAPYPDELRMILGGVQRLDLTERQDENRRNHQLSRLDNALIEAGRTRVRTPPGRALIAVGTVIAAIGVIGVVLGFALFVYLGISEVGHPSFGGGIPRPVYGWGLFAISAVIAGAGASMRRAGRKKGI